MKKAPIFRVLIGIKKTETPIFQGISVVLPKLYLGGRSEVIRTPDFFVPKSYVRLLSKAKHNILCFRVFGECSLKLNSTLFSYSPTLSVGYMWSLANFSRRALYHFHQDNQTFLISGLKLSGSKLSLTSHK